MAIAALAPLAAGGVHRTPLFVFMAGGAIGLGLFAVGTTMSGRTMRVGAAALLPLLFLIIPLLQSIPLPMGARRLLDPRGSALLADDETGGPATAPFSLDPPNTRVNIGQAALGLAIFLVAFHLASGQRRRHYLLRVIAFVGIAAVTIGATHRLLGLTKIFGIVSWTDRSLLIGPFVNANHTAELLELTAFACLACSFQIPSALNRFGWLTGMLLCLGGVAATLSRGGVVALAMAVMTFTFLHYVGKNEQGGRHRRESLVWGAFLVGFALLGAGAFGAGRLVDRFQSGTITSDLRFQVWRDSLRVLMAHPLGIGRGAFDRVFPIYRTIKTPQFSLRFAFVENEPLQLLIDSGWALFTALVAAMGLVVWQIVRNGRRDKIEAALLSGLVAVFVHNLVDFGLETLGVLLPFMAILGTVLGRLRSTHARTAPSRGVLLAACACTGLIIGAASVAHASYDNFDALLKKSVTNAARHEILLRAQRTHPTDYYYQLVDAPFEPIKGQEGRPSPRFHALNRALTLCPTCEAVHVEVARTLWGIGRRQQALLEWRSALILRPQLLSSALGELFAAGSSPQELASIASFNPARLTDVADFLGSVSRPADALTVLSQSEALGVPRTNLLLVRAKLQLQMGQTSAAAATLAEAQAAGVHDVRLALLDAQLILTGGSTGSADRALAILDQAATENPLDVPVQRARVDLVMNYGRWQATERALEGLKEALYRSRGSALEAHIAGARIYGRLARWPSALDEYRVALADARSDLGLWMEYGHAAQTAGHNTWAREAFEEAARLSPQNPEIARSLQAVEDDQARLRARVHDINQP